VNILVDQWSGLFSELESKVNADGRRKLMFQVVGALYDSALSNFNGELSDGDMRPWHDEELRSAEYALLVERDFATLYRTEEERKNCAGTKWEGGTGTHLRDDFTYFFDSESAVLRNNSDYASNVQLGQGQPARPFFPVDENGDLMPFMQERLAGVVESYFQSQSH
jgi:phage gpG-like protein